MIGPWNLEGLCHWEREGERFSVVICQGAGDMPASSGPEKGRNAKCKQREEVGIRERFKSPTQPRAPE